MISSSEAFFLTNVHMSMAKIVLLLLKMEVSEDIKAANITASIKPRAPKNSHQEPVVQKCIS